MPYKYLQEKGITVKKQKYRVSNWSEYNASLKRRGDVEIWLSQEAIDNWYVSDRIYDGTGTPDLYSDVAIIICYELQQDTEAAATSNAGIYRFDISYTRIRDEMSGFWYIIKAAGTTWAEDPSL